MNAARREEDFERWIAAFDHVQNIVKGRAIGAGDEADTSREPRDWAFARWREEAFGIEFLLEAFEGGLEFAFALQFEVYQAELILAARFVNSHLALNDDFLAVLKEGAIEAAAIGLEENATDLGVLVFECEVGVAGGLEAEVGDFAGDPREADGGFEGAPDFGGEFGDGEDAAFRGCWLGRGFAEVPLSLKRFGHSDRSKVGGVSKKLPAVLGGGLREAGWAHGLTLDGRAVGCGALLRPRG